MALAKVVSDSEDDEAEAEQSETDDEDSEPEEGPSATTKPAQDPKERPEIQKRKHKHAYANNCSQRVLISNSVSQTDRSVFKAAAKTKNTNRRAKTGMP